MRLVVPLTLLVVSTHLAEGRLMDGGKALGQDWVAAVLRAKLPQTSCTREVATCLGIMSHFL